MTAGRVRSARDQRELLAALVRRAIDQAQQSGALPPFTPPPFIVETPRERERGDFATNAALVCASEARRPPREVAAAIVAHLDPEAGQVAEVEVAGPGFINFRLRPTWLYQVLRAAVTEGAEYGRTEVGAGRRVQVEFVSANPTGPMNVVNARAAAIGDCLANLLEATGHEVVREYYVNDAGNQALLFARSVEARLAQQVGEERAFPEDGYPGEYVAEIAAEMLQEHPELREMGQEERVNFLRIHAVDRMVERQRASLERFGVRFDVWFRERDLHAAGRVQAVLEELRRRGQLYEQEGATWFRSTAFGDDKDRVVVKSDGTVTYLAGDIAYHQEKFSRGFDTVIDIWGPDHHGYVARTKAAMAALGIDPDRFEVLLLQLVTLVREGKPVRMSKRAGEFITMDELLEEVGKDVARFFFLFRSLDSHLEFDLDLARLQSDENPVYYVQYAHARIASIFRQAAEQGIPVPETAAEARLLELLSGEAEMELIRQIARFSDEVCDGALRREPHRVAYFVHQLASSFHAFYNQVRVLDPDPEVRAARLLLARAVQNVIRASLLLMGIEPVERM